MTGYSHLILDVDGVLLDSNHIKEKNIRTASSPYANEEELDEFLSYFTGNNGIPRQGKVEKYFGKGSLETEEILATYAKLNKDSLLKAPLTIGTIPFLDRWHGVLPIIALSGGEESEVRKVLKEKNINEYFSAIYGGPVSKSDHLKRLNLTGKILYVGDSKHDIEIAEEFNFDFVFMYQYTQFIEWEHFLCNKPEIIAIRNLAEWPQSLNL